MRRFFKLVFFLILVSGWVLFAMSVHVVRAPGQIKWVGQYLPDTLGTFQVVTKESMTFHDTFLDTRHWELQDVADHRATVQRFRVAGKGWMAGHMGTEAEVADALKGIVPVKAPPKPPTPVVTPTPEPAPYVPPTATPTETPTRRPDPPKQKSIFDF